MNISVVVPVYNSEDTIRGCLDALMKQDDVSLGQDYEILVVDDGSTDNSVAITKQYPVRVLDLGENKGRIIARKRGAEESLSSKILFVDSRVLLAPDFIKTLIHINHSPVMVGDLMEMETKYNSVFHTFFYLVRRKIYGKNHFPQSRDEFWINEDNFTRAPKGTTVLFIDRNLFLEILPECKGVNVSDDTLMFHNLIFDKGQSLLRHNNLRAEYLQRTDLKTIIPWLFHRGIRFADYYCRPGGKLFHAFLTVTIILLVIGMLSVFSLLNLFYLMCFVGVAYVGIVAYLSDNLRDYLIIFFILPFMLLIFGAGILKFWYLFLLKRQ